MFTLLETLSRLIQEYTIADTAYVISIVEGLATVVAAVGAIIAVVITKKIASKQISIAEKQNEISMKQADIAQQQNRIALFECRSTAFDKLLSFINLWVLFSKESTEGLRERVPTVNSFQAFISYRELGELDLDFVKSKDWFYFRRESLTYFFDDINCIARILRLFRMTNESHDFLVMILREYKSFQDAINSMKYPNYDVAQLEEIGLRLSDYSVSKECSSLVTLLASQISFNEV